MRSELCRDAFTFVRNWVFSEADENSSETFMSPVQYVRAFGSIHMTLPRQVGKTTFIGTSCRAGDLVIVRNSAAADMFYSRFGVNAMSAPNIHLAFGPNQDSRLRGTHAVWSPKRPPARIWFDEIPYPDVQQLMELLIVSSRQRVVSLGTM